MTLHGVLTVIDVECAKLAAQFKVRFILACCIAGPFAFAAALRVQSNLPSDTLFGRSVSESGFAVPLVVLGFAALWVFPLIACSVGGDVFSAEDRYGTWPTLLTRSRDRGEVFAGKVATALAFSAFAVVLLGVSSVAAGLLVIGRQPLINLSGRLIAPDTALVRVAASWASVVPAIFAFTTLGVLLSVVTRSSVAGVGLPVVCGLTMQLYSLVDGPESVRRLLMTTGFGAWHGLLTEPAYYRPLVHSITMSAIYSGVCLVIAFHVLRRRDIGN